MTHRNSLRESRMLGIESGCQDYPRHLLCQKTMEGGARPCWGWAPGFLTLSPRVDDTHSKVVFACGEMGLGLDSHLAPTSCLPFRHAGHPAGTRRGLNCSCLTSSSWALWRVGFSRPPATWGSCLPGRCSLGSLCCALILTGACPMGSRGGDCL